LKPCFVQNKIHQSSKTVFIFPLSGCKKNYRSELFSVPIVAGKSQILMAAAHLQR
jgi:hypothetical protein